jgi:hypothetical protein
MATKPMNEEQRIRRSEIRLVVGVSVACAVLAAIAVVAFGVAIRGGGW